jgi:iron-sulfur cluster assembly protein
MRIIISSSCCNSVHCGLRLERGAQPDDKILDYGAVKVFIDQKSAPLIDGATIDFVDDLGSSGFRFTNLKSRNS